jgi:dynein heavy chain, axonemal
LIFRT